MQDSFLDQQAAFFVKIIVQFQCLLVFDSDIHVNAKILNPVSAQN